MKFTPDKCPECGADIESTIENLPGLARVFRQEDGSYEWAGETEILWDGAETETNDKGESHVRCEQGHTFYANLTASH